MLLRIKVYYDEYILCVLAAYSFCLLPSCQDYLSLFYEIDQPLIEYSSLLRRHSQGIEALKRIAELVYHDSGGFKSEEKERKDCVTFL